MAGKVRAKKDGTAQFDSVFARPHRLLPTPGTESIPVPEEDYTCDRNSCTSKIGTIGSSVATHCSTREIFKFQATTVIA